MKIGHLLAFITIFIWGTTYISTKVLLDSFTPVQILFIRFVIGVVALSIACPHILKLKDKKQELIFMGAGLTGVTLYYLLENIALSYTLASNVGVIISVAPFFTAILTRIFYRKDEKLSLNFFIGFIIAMIGIGVILAMTGLFISQGREK